MKKRAKILSILLLILCTSGCWDSQRLSSRALVAGIGIDRNDQGEIELTAQIIKPGGLNPNSASGGSSEESVFVASTTGRTIFDAVRQFSKTVSRKLYFEQNRIVVFDQEIAEEGLTEFIDFFMRDHETRKRAFILVCKKSAKSFLSAKSDIEKIPASEVLALMHNQSSTSEVAINDLHGLSIQIESPYTSPYAPLVCTQTKEDGEEKVAFFGTAAFKEDKLVGFLDAKESRGLLFLQNKIKSGIIVIISPEDNVSNIALEIINVKSSYKPSLVNGQFVIDLNIFAVVSIGDIQMPISLIGSKRISQIQQRCKQEIISQVDACLYKLQEDLKTDIIGIGESIYNKYPKQWKEFSSNWPNNFNKIKINTNVKVQIEHTGIITDPLQKQK
ncbi:Ger(x)C family spore germination protein [Clostridium sp. 'deep sea']|uniref:Ger(x)C family spore germination protein n=1 Tax=Clostridium sp. 'deep sea' TaxID=2779445 RepID=UPI00189677B1|nr:Ger(x)C family spore germination protein [Clostridium sp. 'deep sea']QOR34188.1 Ger(x)C family spore germination protein [Clostridium sp. 'deep sea']